MPPPPSIAPFPARYGHSDNVGNAETSDGGDLTRIFSSVHADVEDSDGVKNGKLRSEVGAPKGELLAGGDDREGDCPLCPNNDSPIPELAYAPPIESFHRRHEAGAPLPTERAGRDLVRHPTAEDATVEWGHAAGVAATGESGASGESGESGAAAGDSLRGASHGHGGYGHSAREIAGGAAAPPGVAHAINLEGGAGGWWRGGDENGHPEAYAHTADEANVQEDLQHGDPQRYLMLLQVEEAKKKGKGEKGGSKGGSKGGAKATPSSSAGMELNLKTAKENMQLKRRESDKAEQADKQEKAAARAAAASGTAAVPDAKLPANVKNEQEKVEKSLPPIPGIAATTRGGAIDQTVEHAAHDKTTAAHEAGRTLTSRYIRNSADYAASDASLNHRTEALKVPFFEFEPCLGPYPPAWAKCKKGKDGKPMTPPLKEASGDEKLKDLSEDTRNMLTRSRFGIQHMESPEWASTSDAYHPYANGIDAVVSKFYGDNNYFLEEREQRQRLNAAMVAHGGRGGVAGQVAGRVGGRVSAYHRLRREAEGLLGVKGMGAMDMRAMDMGARVGLETGAMRVARQRRATRVATTRDSRVGVGGGRVEGGGGKVSSRVASKAASKHPLGAMEYTGPDKGSPLTVAGSSSPSAPNFDRAIGDYEAPHHKQGPTSGILKIDPTAASAGFVPKKEDDPIPGSKDGFNIPQNLPYAGVNPAQPAHSDPPPVGVASPTPPNLSNPSNW